MKCFTVTPDPSLDLVLERIAPVAPELVWRAYTTPALLEQWFCPRPYRAVDWKIELYPGGAFCSVIVSPEGDRFPGDGCVLEAVENRRLTFTSALGRGFRPNPPSGPEEVSFTAFIEIEPHGSGSLYRATVVHPDPETRSRHEAMGFDSGWGTAFDQLVELMKGEA